MIAPISTRAIIALAAIDKDYPPALQFKKAVNGNGTKCPDAPKKAGHYTPGNSCFGAGHIQKEKLLVEVLAEVDEEIIISQENAGAFKEWAGN